MRTVSTTIDINAPATRVWAMMSDVERWPGWTASMTRVERLDAAPIRVGSRIRVTQPKLATAVFDVYVKMDAAGLKQRTESTWA